MPFLDSPKGRSDGGYAVADFRKVKPELGTMDELAELAEKCHEKGISLCMDFVMNHTSEDHEWAKTGAPGRRRVHEPLLLLCGSVHPAGIREDGSAGVPDDCAGELSPIFRRWGTM